MTDDAEDRGDAPHLWPPVSVWLAVTLLLVPPLALILYHPLTGRGGYVLGAFGMGGLMFGAAPSVGLLRGWRSGVTGAAWYAGIVLALFGYIGMALVVYGQTRALLTSPLPAFIAWVVCVLATLWWPETRRWCGRLPPTEDEA